MPRIIQKAAVLGAGVMGAQIAAHLANAGIPCYLLDIVPPALTPDEEAKGLTTASPAVRNRFATGALKKLREMKPSPIMHPDVLERITPGNFADHLAWLQDADWVCEAIVERLDIKQQLWQQVAQHVRPGTILTSNTSGLSIAAQAEVLPPEHRRNFLGTHFFNPPRYLKLLELIPIADTDPAVTEFFAQFGAGALGKGIVMAKDTPNFIANRLGTYGMAVTFQVMARLGLGVDEVDAMTGPAMGRPKTATFRLADLVGLDTMLHVIRNTAATTTDPEEKALLTPPAYLEEMVQRGWIGDKAGQGFFKKVKGKNGESEILSLNLQTLEYGPRVKARFPSLEQARNITDRGARVKFVIAQGDLAAQFTWNVLKRVLLFCARKAHEIAGGDLAAIDRAMRLGFNWEIGPFATWNAIGVQESVARMEAEGEQVPDWVKGVQQFDVPTPAREKPLSFTALKAGRTRVLKQAPGATVVDLGDEVLGLDFHGTKQALGQDYVVMANWAADECVRNWRGLVISAEAPNFCVGANLALVLMEAQDENWEDIDRAIREMQNVMTKVKYLPRPTVVAPYGMTLGGGMEVTLHCARTVAAAETYMGQVEVGVGLVPAAGGCKELTARFMQMMPPGQSQLPNQADPQAYINRVFEYIATARVATSALEAKALGFLRPTDKVVMNGDHLLHHAKQVVLGLDREGYRPPAPARIPVLGPDGRAVLELAAYTLQNSGYATEHDVYIAKKLARILTGGDLPGGTAVPEQYLLDLEREAFLSLCGHPKTQARMLHILTKNKPLRN